MNLNNELGELLKKLRGINSLRTIAAKTNDKITHVHLSNFEKGSHKPKPEYLKILSEVYNYPYDELMKLAGYIQENPKDMLQKVFDEVKKMSKEERQKLIDMMKDYDK